MSEQKSDGAMKEVGEGLKSILERVADFFDIFDLSFLVSGFTALTAIRFLVWRAGVLISPLPQSWVAVVAILIGCYVMGLVCFAVGRRFSRALRLRKGPNSLDRAIEDALEGHGLAADPLVQAYLVRKNDRGTWRLYVRMWAEARVVPTLAPSFSLLRRYWVMAATYDGVAVALLVWAAALIVTAFGIGDIKPISKVRALPIAGTLILAALACSREAGRFVEYQVEELIATIAAKRDLDNSSK